MSLVMQFFEELPDINSFEINEVIVGDKEIKNNPDLHRCPAVH